MLLQSKSLMQYSCYNISGTETPGKRFHCICICVIQITKCMIQSGPNQQKRMVQYIYGAGGAVVRATRSRVQTPPLALKNLCALE